MKKIFSIILASFFMVSCVDTVILPDNEILDEDYWQTKSDVEAVVSAAYAQLRSAELMRNLIVWSDFRSDELELTSTLPTTATYEDDLEAIYSMNITPENAFTTWGSLYSAINYCNLVLEKAEQVMDIDPDYAEGDYTTNRSQMLALRSLCYFYLVRVFRDVPVTPGAYMNSSQDMNQAQSAPADVLQMCIDDLLEAEQYAPAGNAYANTASYSYRDRGYLNRDGIDALLADIYLWRASVNHSSEDYQLCVDYCDKVIAAKKDAHTLDATMGETEEDYYLDDLTEYYRSIFYEGESEEIIFEVLYTTSSTSNAGLSMMYNAYRNSTSDGYGYFKTTETYSDVNQSASSSNIFKNANDQRLYTSVYSCNSSVEQYDVRKYMGTTNLSSATSESRTNIVSNNSRNWIIYRLTDVMLMKAEALVQLGQNEDAFNLCKAVNDRALVDESSALAYSTYSDRMESLVLMERARELCFEGKRWFDLLRYNYRRMEGVDYTTILADQSSYVSNSSDFFSLALDKYTSATAMQAKMPTEPYLYMPISQDEMDLNFDLKQNPVYE